MTRADLRPLFVAETFPQSDNLEIVGVYRRRLEMHKHVTVWPNSGLLRWQNGSLEFEPIWTRENLRQCYDYHSKWSRLPKPVKGTYFNVNLFWGNGYYHWICDVLPRLFGLSDATTDFRFLLPRLLMPWQERSLELLDVPRDQCIRHMGRRPLKVERLLYASPVAMTGDHEPQSLDWVRTTILRNCLSSSPPRMPRRRIYVTRRSARCRSIANEDKLLPLLENYEFEVVDCSGLTFDQQIQLFSEAQCVAGPHGAGLTNILWCPPGARVLEFFEPSAIRRCYWSMCQVLGHTHLCGVGTSVCRVDSEPDMEVAPEDFARSLERAVLG